MAVNEPMLSTQESVAPTRKVYDAYEYRAETVPSEFPATRGIFVNVAATYKLYFADRPATAMTMILPAGLTQPFSIIKIADTDDTVVAANAISLLY